MPGSCLRCTPHQTTTVRSISLPRAGRRLLLLLLLLGMISRAHVAQAAPVDPGGDQPCVDCHSIEAMTWEASPHAALDPTTGAPGAGCTTCHGRYSEAHPDDDLMALDVSSATCATCHTATYAQWESTIHAQGDVQCISCHQAHSQDLRLDRATLCASCHTTPQDDTFHTAHWLGDVACTDCHMSPPTATGEIALASAANRQTTLASHQIAAVDAVGDAFSDASTHDFVTVAAPVCLDCHKDDVQSATTGDQPGQISLLAKAETNSQLASQLKSAQSDLRTLRGMTPMALGMGLGMGGILGIVFMLVAADKPRGDRPSAEHDSEQDDGGLS